MRKKVCSTLFDSVVDRKIAVNSTFRCTFDASDGMNQRNRKKASNFWKGRKRRIIIYV